MCLNYRVPESALFPAHYGCSAPSFDYAREAWPRSVVPILVHDDDAPGLAARRASFGLRPPWARDPNFARKTCNARTETVADRPSYRRPWRLRQFCLVPTIGFFEPNYESGTAVRWLVERQDRRPFALAGIWEALRDAEGLVSYSFSLLTINADAHALMRRFHAPGREKRSVVVIPPDAYRAWIYAASESEARALLVAFPVADFTALAAPREPAPARRRPSARD